MGIFAIAKVQDYNVKQGDTEEMTFQISGFDLSLYDVIFKGVCQTGSILKGNRQDGLAENEDITVSAFEYNMQTVVVNFGTDDFKAMQGIMKYEIQIMKNDTIYTIIEGKIIISAEIIK